MYILLFTILGGDNKSTPTKNNILLFRTGVGQQDNNVWTYSGIQLEEEMILIIKTLFLIILIPLL